MAEDRKCDRCGKVWLNGDCTSTPARRGLCARLTQTFKVGDLVLLPDDSVATVVYLAVDGGVAVETPWSAQWRRFSPGALRHVEGAPHG